MPHAVELRKKRTFLFVKYSGKSRSEKEERNKREKRKIVRRPPIVAVEKQSHYLGIGVYRGKIAVHFVQTYVEFFVDKTARHPYRKADYYM